MEAPLSLLARNLLSSRAMVVAAVVAGNSKLMVLGKRMCSSLPSPSEFRPAKALVLTKTSRFEYERARHKGEFDIKCDFKDDLCFIGMKTPHVPDQKF